MVKLNFKSSAGLRVLETLSHNGQFIPDIINRRVLGQVGYAVKDSKLFNKRLTDRPSYKNLTGQALGFKKRMFASRGLAGQEGMLYNVAPKKNKVTIYLVKEDLFTREEAIKYKKTAMQDIMNNSKSRWKTASEKAVSDTFKAIGWA